ncbi:MAG: MarR family transcriptional regulator [Rhodopseudomonas sp.]|nr:MarR family transcriptional regulator [Rhodopseudomonas sp.]
MCDEMLKLLERAAALSRPDATKRPKKRSTAKPRRDQVDLPFAESIGYQIRTTHRALQRLLQLKIEPSGVTLGMWYFLRALWNEDGLTQRELSRRVGTMEPTTMSAILNMEKSGLVRRVRDKTDRRKIHVHLTAKGSRLRNDLVPLAKDVVSIAANGLSAAEIKQFLGYLSEVQKNLQANLSQMEEAEAYIFE